MTNHHTGVFFVVIIIAAALMIRTLPLARSLSSTSTSTFPIFYNDVYKVHLPPHHRFPMAKYRHVRTRLEQELLLNKKEAAFFVSPLATVQELETTHHPEYIQRFLHGQMTRQELRNVGFPWSPSGVDRALSSVGGTLAAARHVCGSSTVCSQWAAHVAGGTHHAFYDYGEGFCSFSDMAVAANVVLQEYPNVVQNILLLDLDVHQGNGNAKLFQNNSNVFTFSLHCSSNYFSAVQESDLDIALPEHSNDATYLATLRHWLNVMKQQQQHDRPFDLILYQAGVDVLEEDRLGRLSLTTAGLERRNQMVYDFAQDKRLVVTMGGGYPRKNQNEHWEPILNGHASVYTQAVRYYNKHVRTADARGQDNDDDEASEILEEERSVTR